MKVISVIVSCMLIASEARIVEFRNPREYSPSYSEESYSDSFSSPSVSSLEDIFEDSDVTGRERPLRAGYYQPSYGYSKNTNKWKPISESVTKSNVKSKPDRTRAKYTAYGKPPQKPWKGFSFGSGQYRKPKPQMTVPVYGDRKKDHRSAQVQYDEGYQGPPPPSQYYTAQAPLLPFYHELQPKPSCGNQLVIGCTPKVTRVPCGFGANAYQQPPPSYYPPAPTHEVVGSPGPVPFPEEPQYLPEHSHGYSPLDSSPMPPPPPPPLSPPATDSGFSYQPSAHDVPQPNPHHLPVAPAGYSFNQPTPQPLTTKQPFLPNKHVSSFFQPKSTAKPSSSFTPYQPTYKIPESSSFPIRTPPSFSHPVKELTNETPHPAPHISAFPSTQGPTTPPTTSTPMPPRRLPTVPADRDQNYRVVIEDEMAAATGTKTEASGDEEPSSTSRSPTPTPSGTTATVTTHVGHDEGHATTTTTPTA